MQAVSRANFETVLAAGSFDLVLSDFNILGFEGLKRVADYVIKTPKHIQRLPLTIYI